MARALGAKFLDDDGNELETRGENLKDVRKVDLSGLDERLKTVKLKALCDVMTPMLGPEGASRKFVVQKGGTTRTMHKLEEGLAMLELHAREGGANGGGLDPGTGAAGGLGYGMRALLGGELLPGAKTVLELIGFESTLQGADLLLTGEGSYDPQTEDGKLITVLAEYANKLQVPLVVLAGAVSHDVQIEGVTAAFGISSYGTRKQDALNAGTTNLQRHAGYVTRLMVAGKP
jgi:glycerate kinase